MRMGLLGDSIPFRRRDARLPCPKGLRDKLIGLAVVGGGGGAIIGGAGTLASAAWTFPIVGNNGKNSDETEVILLFLLEKKSFARLPC